MWNPPGKRRRGRPRNTRRSVESEMKKVGQRWMNLERVAPNRKRWWPMLWVWVRRRWWWWPVNRFSYWESFLKFEETFSWLLKMDFLVKMINTKKNVLFTGDCYCVILFFFYAWTDTLSRQLLVSAASGAEKTNWIRIFTWNFRSGNSRGS